MKGFGAASAIAAVGLLAQTAVATTPAIEIYGTKFFYSNNGSQFFIKGVAYQEDYTGGGAGTTGESGLSYVDPLTKPAACKRDIPYLKELETNVIRVYTIDPTGDHTECMQMLQDNDIYVFADLAAPVTGESIDSSDPAWNTELYARYTSVIDAMAKYDNVIGFFAGNEVSDQINNTDAMAYVKAAVRDTKAYIKSTASRDLYVGYAADDDAAIRVAVSEYMVCGDSDDAVDFWGYNIYEWCGADSSYTISGYKARTEEFASYAKPAFFSEYGCITPPPRTFEDTPVLLGPKMDTVWSGGIVYEYFNAANDYGLVTVVDDVVTTLTGFASLSTEIRKASPTSTAKSDYTTSNTAWSCPSDGTTWEAAATPLPPTPNKKACECMYDSLTCVVKDSTSVSKYGKYFGYVCGLKDGKFCDGIDSNGTSGDYGAWSMCTDEQQLAYVYNEYYEYYKSADASACGFGDTASTKAAVAAKGTCKSLIDEAGTDGTGTVTATPSGSAAASGSGSAAASGSASGSGTASSSGASVPNFRPSYSSGLLPAALLATLACVSGVGMVLL